MPVYKDPKPSKNGNCWFFKINYQDSFGNNKQKRSKNYATKKEAKTKNVYSWLPLLTKLKITICRSRIYIMNLELIMIKK